MTPLHRRANRAAGRPMPGGQCVRGGRRPLARLGPTLAVLLSAMLATVSACGTSSSHTGLSNTAPGGSSGGGAPPTVSSITTCLRGLGGSTNVAVGPAPGSQAINGRLKDVQYTIVVTRSDTDGRNVLQAFVGLAGGSHTVDGVPIQEILKRSGPIVIFYPGHVEADVSRQIEACFGDHATLDPDIMASLRPSGCSGASGAAMAEVAKPPSASTWKPDHVEGGGCSVTFASSQSAPELVSGVKRQLSSHGWHESSPIGEGDGLLYMTRDGLVAVLLPVGAGHYSLYITPAGNLG